MSFTHKAVLDDITLVTALLCDDRITLDETQAENHPQKRASVAHCRWALNVSMPEQEFDQLVHEISFRKDERSYSYSCERCGLAWVDDGPCDVECAGRGPSFYLFDEKKATVIAGLRAARQELADERNEGKLYA
jgi:hypothetical protein